VISKSFMMVCRSKAPARPGHKGLITDYAKEPTGLTQIVNFCLQNSPVSAPIRVPNHCGLTCRSEAPSAPQPQRFSRELRERTNPACRKEMSLDPQNSLVSALIRVPKSLWPDMSLEA
jgi:hypothetical protein